MQLSHGYRGSGLLLIAACAMSDPTLSPPCDLTGVEGAAECERLLQQHYDGHQCIEYRCIRPVQPDASNSQQSPAPGIDAGGGGMTVYDAGATNHDASEPQCRRDSDCEAGEFCQSGFCLSSGVPPRADTGGRPDSGVTNPPDAGVADPPDSGVDSELPDIGGGPMLPDIGGGPMLPDAEAPLVPDVN